MGHLKIPGDTFGCDNEERGVAMVSSRYKPGMLQTSYKDRVLTQSELPGSQANSAEVEKP